MSVQPSQDTRHAEQWIEEGIGVDQRADISPSSCNAQLHVRTTTLPHSSTTPEVYQIGEEEYSSIVGIIANA